MMTKILVILFYHPGAKNKRVCITDHRRKQEQAFALWLASKACKLVIGKL
jgi:hypothetical protein